MMRRRFLATLLDFLLLWMLQIPIITAAAITAALLQSPLSNATINLLATIFSVAINLVYFGIFYSAKGATPGKIICGLKVIDVNSGEYISFLRTTLREVFAKSLSALLLMIGFLLPFFRADGRALHDLLCDTRVIREDSPETESWRRKSFILAAIMLAIGLIGFIVFRKIRALPS